MTPEEVIAEVEAQNRKELVAMNLEPNEALLNMLNLASIRGFQLGSQAALSMVKGALTVQAASLKK